VSVSLLDSGGDLTPGKISQTGWVAQRNLDIEEWIAAGRLLGGMSRCSQWGIGDWIRYGNAKFGERYKRASEITGYDPQTLMNMVYVASRFEFSRRREMLSWSHHEVVAGLEVREQDRWLDRAVTEGWQRSHLRSLVRGERDGHVESSRPHRVEDELVADHVEEDVLVEIGELEVESGLDDGQRETAVSAVGVIDEDSFESSMRSPVNWALLGLLIERPSYGYELTQRFEYTYGELIELSSPSHVYTALEVLLRRGMIEAIQGSEVDGATPRQAKLHYAATSEGVAGYEEHLVEDATEERRRGQLFALKMIALVRGQGRGAEVLDRCEEACDEEVAKPTRIVGGGIDGGGRITEELVDENDRLLVEAKRSWFIEARDQMEKATLGSGSSLAV
jgi:DNA-binding PadR family transcriptional regulator